MTLLSSTRRHLRKFPQSNPFRKDDIALYVKISGYQLVRILKIKPQYCYVFASDRKTKTVHCSLLCLVYRPQTGCSSFTDQLQDDQDDDNNDNDVIVQTEEETQQKCVFSYFFSPRIGHHHDISAGSECPLSVTDSCPGYTCDTGRRPGPPSASPRDSGDEDWGMDKQTIMSGRQYDHASSEHQTQTKVKFLWSPLLFPVRPSFLMARNTL